MLHWKIEWLSSLLHLFSPDKSWCPQQFLSTYHTLFTFGRHLLCRLSSEMNFVAAGTRLPLNFRDCRQTLRPGEACGTSKGPKIQTLPLTAAATTQQPNSPTGRLAGILLSIWLSISRRKDRRHYEAIKLDGSGNIFEGKYNLNLLWRVVRPGQDGKRGSAPGRTCQEPVVDMLRSEQSN